MPDLVFPPTLFRRLKEFSVSNAFQTPIPSPGAIPGTPGGTGGVSSKLLGTAPIGVYQAGTIGVLGYYVDATIEGGGKGSDALQGFIEAILRDTTVQANPTADGIYKSHSGTVPTVQVGVGGASDPGALTGVLLGTPAVLSAASKTEQDNESFFFSSSSGVVRGDKLALDVYFRVANFNTFSADPGLWLVDQFQCVLDLFLYQPLPT